VTFTGELTSFFLSDVSVETVLTWYLIKKNAFSKYIPLEVQSTRKKTKTVGFAVYDLG